MRPIREKEKNILQEFGLLSLAKRGGRGVFDLWQAQEQGDINKPPLEIRMDIRRRFLNIGF